MLVDKSCSEFVLGLFSAQLKDCALQYPALAKEFRRDETRLISAVEHHGIRFVLDTMPVWRKHFDMCLATGRLTPSNLLNLGSWKRGGTVPRFLRGLILRVFDLYGEMKPDPDLHAIRWIRQLFGVARRLRIDCGPKNRSDAVREFIRTDLETRSGDLDWSSARGFSDVGFINLSFTEGSYDPRQERQGSFPFFEVPSLDYRHAECVQQVADYMTSCLGSFNPLEARFRHGPGAVSDQRFGEFKYDFRSWPDRLDSVFPMADFACANYAVWEDSTLYKTPDWVHSKEYPAKLCAVPKTVSTPRLIASEPTALQWCQQSIRSFLYSGVSNSRIGAFVDFRRQDVNGELALRASRDGSHATIDLSSASDRVSCWHVERLFRRSPTLLDALRATRSVYIEQDICRVSPRFHKLRKYSTMGNATTFPVQSLFFLAVALGSLAYVRKLRVGTEMIREAASSEVRVFGDDIIVPKDCAGATIDALSALGLRVNTKKTFTEGNFRESCGVDAYSGEDVTTVSVLDVPKRAKPGSIVSSVDVHNNLCNKGYYHTASAIRKTVERVGVKLIPTVTDGSGLFGWHSNWVDRDLPLKSRWNPALQIREWRCVQVSSSTCTRQSNESAALLQFFTEAPREVQSGVSTLHYPEQRAKATLRLRWAALR